MGIAAHAASFQGGSAPPDYDYRADAEAQHLAVMTCRSSATNAQRSPLPGPSSEGNRRFPRT
eukprot:7755567-Alexandrium_andersonii.AAC.1